MQHITQGGLPSVTVAKGPLISVLLQNQPKFGIPKLAPSCWCLGPPSRVNPASQLNYRIQVPHHCVTYFTLLLVLLQECNSTLTPTTANSMWATPEFTTKQIEQMDVSLRRLSFEVMMVIAKVKGIHLSFYPDICFYLTFVRFLFCL